MRYTNQAMDTIMNEVHNLTHGLTGLWGKVENDEMQITIEFSDIPFTVSYLFENDHNKPKEIILEEVLVAQMTEEEEKRASARIDDLALRLENQILILEAKNKRA